MEITPQRLNWLAEDAVRRETVSRADLPAIFDLQGDFQKLQGEPILLPVSFSNSFKILERVLPDLRSREHFWYCREGAGSIFGIAGKSSVELRIVAGLARG